MEKEKITQWEDLIRDPSKYLSETELIIKYGVKANSEIVLDFGKIDGRIKDLLLNDNSKIFLGDLYIKGKSINFKNCSFNNKVIFETIPKDAPGDKQEININHCKILGSIYTKQLQAPFYQKLGDSDIILNIYNTNINNEQKFENTIKSIKLINCLFNKISFLNYEPTFENNGTDILIKYKSQENTPQARYNRGGFNEIEKPGIASEIIFTNNFKINELNIIGNNGKFNSIIFDNIAFKNRDNGYFLRNLSCDNLRFKNFTNNAEIFKIHNVNVIDEFIVNDGDFGKANFNNVRLNNIFFKGVVFSDCIFNNVLWYNINFLSESKYFKEDIIDISSINFEIKDIYRQLKFVMDKNGNYTQGNNFYVKEMLWYGNSYAKYSGMRLLFYFKNYIGNFGNNWMKSSKLLLLLVFFYTLFEFIFIKTTLVFDFSVFSKLAIGIINHWKDFIKEYFLNIYPLSNLDKSEIVKMLWWHIPILLIYKILYGVLIFYIGVGLKRSSRRN